MNTTNKSVLEIHNYYFLMLLEFMGKKVKFFQFFIVKYISNRYNFNTQYILNKTIKHIIYYIPYN